MENPKSQCAVLQRNVKMEPQMTVSHQKISNYVVGFKKGSKTTFCFSNIINKMY